MPFHMNEDPNPVWRPTFACPFCGSTNLRIGCQYQDCQECDDVEQSECLSCGVGFGGANYWQSPGAPRP